MDSPFHELSGNRFSTARGPSGGHKDDPIDASVLHFSGTIPETIRESSLVEEHLDPNTNTFHENFHAIMGYRANRSKNIGGISSCELEILNSSEISESDYLKAGVNRSLHAMIHYEEKHRLGRLWQTSPNPRGMSGGGIVRISGLPTDLFAPAKPTLKPLLTAITIEHRPKRGKNIPVIIGTRICVHLDLISRYMPDMDFST